MKDLLGVNVLYGHYNLDKPLKKRRYKTNSDLIMFIHKLNIKF